MANEIILTFDFESSPPVGDLGDVFAALARDYREISKGGTLVAMRVESGSIIVTVTDAVLAAAPYVVATLATMAAINTVAKFAENLKTWFGHAKADEWPAPGSEDTELGVLMELEVDHGTTEVYAGVQA